MANILVIDGSTYQSLAIWNIENSILLNILEVNNIMVVITTILVVELSNLPTMLTKITRIDHWCSEVVHTKQQQMRSLNSSMVLEKLKLKMSILNNFQMVKKLDHVWSCLKIMKLLRNVNPLLIKKRSVDDISNCLTIKMIS